MNRRNILHALLALLALGLAPFASEAQESVRQYRIAWLSNNTPESSKYLENAFKQGLRELGYVEGKNTVFEFRWAMGKSENVPGLAQELVALKPDVILAGTILTARPLQKATTTIPIVGTLTLDPVGNGLAKSLARPGGNFTGRASLGEDTSGKLLELLLAATPKLSRVGVLWNSVNPGHTAILKRLEAAAKSLGVSVLSIGVQNPSEIDNGLARMAQENIRGFISLQDALILKQGKQIAELALRYRMASIHTTKELAQDGGLISYGVSYTDEYKRAATFVDKILKGAKAGDIPIEQAMTFELVVNLKTAKALGIKIPPSLLLRADEVIE